MCGEAVAVWTSAWVTGGRHDSERDLSAFAAGHRHNLEVRVASENVWGFGCRAIATRRHIRGRRRKAYQVQTLLHHRGSCGSCVAATRISTTYFAGRRQWRRCPRLRSGESRAGSAMTIALTWWLSEAMVFFSAGNQALLCTVNHRPCGLLGSAVPRPSQGLHVRSEKLDLAQSIGDAFRLPEQLSHSLARSREASWDSPAGGALKKSVAERSPDNSRPVVS